MKCLCIIVLLFFCQPSFAQQLQPDQEDIEESNNQQLEELSETQETETEDEYDLQQLVSYSKHPLNINDPASVLKGFPLLDPLLTDNLISYRELFGNFISVYELQAVPGFTIDLIKRILPYITVAEIPFHTGQLKERWQAGQQTLLIRTSFVPQISKGFDSNRAGTQLFTGSRPKIFTRYTYRYRDLLQYGILGDKDAGEPLPINKPLQAFDFYSFHLFLRKLGIIKSLAIGDFTVNMGQGLIHWQSQAFKKSSGVINIKRQSETLRPYHSAGEYNFYRGAGITLRRNNIECTVFGSSRKISANISFDEEYGNIITSVETSGLHRTENEINDKNTVRVITTGASLKWEKNINHIGINAVSYFYSLPILKRDEPYNLFAIKGNKWANYSVDYNYTYRNYHLFGEAAIDREGNTAIVNGLMSSLGASLDIALLYRSIGKAYQSLYGNAFTENTMPSNESGFYFGISLKPALSWKLDMYADIFSFPWLKYRVDAPGYGFQSLIQLSWKPDKKTEVYTRFRSRCKPLNASTPLSPLNYPEDIWQKNWRTHISFQASRNVLLRTRLEICRFEPSLETGSVETGFLFYTDVAYKPLGKWYRGSARFQVFETDGYSSRIYAYENDLFYSNSTPSFFDDGARIYLNLRGHFKLKSPKNAAIDIGFKVSSTIYTNKSVIGSGPDEIAGNRKSEVKIQVIFSKGE